MIVHFDGVDINARTGPGTFANRLARELFNQGHEVEFSQKKSKVSLVFIEPSGQKLANKIVQRIDGIWFKPDDFKVKNKRIKSLYESADSVIFQSCFDQQMITKWWGFRKNLTNHIVRNGIDITPIKNLTIPALEKLRHEYQMIFVCSANWHKQKRLSSNIELFKHLRQNYYVNSCLIVLGNNPDLIVADPHIFYTGSLSSDEYMQVYAISNWMIHLAWADHAPNVVVEALSQNTPVICSDVGGTKELIGDFGIVLKDEDYDYELYDYDNPPKIDVTQIQKLPEKNKLGKHVDIDIKNITKKYIDVFNELIGK
jgi:glycosyltransferase involved in cell wall biosynthesis